MSAPAAALAWACLLAALAAFGLSQRVEGKAMLTEDKVMEIAIAEFERHMKPASDYDITLAPYPTGDPDHWMVWFERKGPFPQPGGRHGVRVHKTTGEALFMKGE